MKKLAAAKIDAELLNALWKRAPDAQKQCWAYTAGYPRKFKDSLTSHLLKEQSMRCAYCGSRLADRNNHRDHIAPKEKHPTFTFVPENLVLACYPCNTVRKGRTDTVSVVKPIYKDCEFTVVHPYFDEPSQHIKYSGEANKILVQVVDGSKKGENTIALFGLDSPEKTKERAKEAAFESDLDYLGSEWRQGFIIAVDANLKIKIRP